MRLASMNQLAVTVKESLKTLTVNNYTGNDENVLSIQNSYIDSVELSDKAIELSMQNDTGKDFIEESETDQGQEGNPGTNQLQEPALTEDVSLNVFA
jgi:hypothetical protein|tara:strand:- start:300 stop:590 length:291 start_codon:yes stop_codon:yes gene_type:complete